ncbi:PD-(D/E)XK nuclease-like domain-containing protein [Tellurirhabdus bombi]|uniref:PD-(D/E)XK nuclease-like domain-containing protein n=1 Tax=Tellurirhabdus bombi TaxID=2907205 RepID=UPI001F3A9C5C|nr:PD-(D/E)XK nuclease-like domain-containing protein [Tellurirhabdus bombi]
MDYCSIPRVSNSDLTRLQEEYLGRGTAPSARFAANNSNAVRESTDRQSVGRAFRHHLVGPESVGSVIQQLLPDMAFSKTAELEPLMPLLRRDSFCKRYLQLAEQNGAQQNAIQGTAQRNRIVLFTEPMTEVACKARLDVVYTSAQRQNALIIDFKTTSAQSQSQFLQSCYDYDYDRQAAYYLDALRFAEGRGNQRGEWSQTRHFRFVLVGIQKQEPNRLFAVDATAIPEFIDYGRKKYRFWLRKWQEREQEQMWLKAS